MRSDFQLPSMLRVEATATMGARAGSVEDVRDALRSARDAKLSALALGEGSNIVPYERVKACAIHVDIRGIELRDESEDDVVVRVGAGENWHAFVMRCLEEGWFGLENLALIPGSVGAAPVQNIGAYGVELADRVAAVHVVNPGDGALRTLSPAACEFGYRTSLFKRKPYVITHLELRLSRRTAPVLTYPDLRVRFDGDADPHPSLVAEAVIQIRQAKLPDPEQYPNVGSFFKNPVVSEAHAAALSEREPGFVTYAVEGGMKLSAAQLIDRAGWKERPGRQVRCWHKQPLVLINEGTDRGADILEYADAIRSDVSERYGVSLSVEPSVLGGSALEDMTP